MPDTLPGMGAISTASTVARALGALVLVGVLAGCTGDSGIVTTTPSPTVVAGSEGPSLTPSPTSSDDGMLTDEELLALMPEGASNETIQGAFLTFRFFIEGYPQALSSRDSSALRALSLPQCDFCANLADGIDDLNESGSVFVAGEVVSDPSSVDLEPLADGRVVVRIDVSQSAFEYEDADGASLGGSEAGRYRMAALMEFDGVLWRVDGVEVEDA